MNKDIEKFNRALNKFLEDNPDLDFDTVKDEFIEMYNKGEYKLDDEYEHANDLYIESLNCETQEEAISLLNEVLEICPYYYEAKIDLLEMNNAVLNEYLELLEEYNSYLDGKLDLENMNGQMWYEIEHRPYLRLLMSIGVHYFDVGDNKAIDYFEEVVRLDENMKLNQELYLLSAYVTFDEISKALNYFKLLPKSLPGHYHLLHALALIRNDDYDKAMKQILLAQKKNPHYLGLFTGVIELQDEDREQMENEMFFEPKSVEEAYINLLLIKDAYIASEENVKKFIIDKYESIIFEITPTPEEYQILIALFNLEPNTMKNIFLFLKGDKYIDREFSGILKDEDDDFIKEHLKEMKRKGFIKESEMKNKYEISYYGFCALKRMTEGIND